MNDASECSHSERNLNTVEYLLKKEYIPQRKISQYIMQEQQRPNFVLHHQAQEYTVVRVYINSVQSSQVRLYYSKFTPKQKEGTICIIHGYGESTDDYIEMAEYFAKNKFVVNMIDLRSFGYSGGKRVNQPIKGLLSDIQNLLTRCCSIGLPTYIISHGFGSLLVFAILQQNQNLPLAGVVAMSPLFSFPFFNQTSFIGKTALWLLSSIFEDMIINNMINPTSLTNNELKVKGCIDGVFNYQFVSIKMIQEYAELSNKVLSQAGKFQYPLLMLYGSENQIQPIDEVRAFYRSVSSKEKKSYIIENGYHQLFKDQKASEQLFPKVLQWIFDENSDKNLVKWKKTPPFKLNVINKVPMWIKLAILSSIPILILIIRRLRKMC